MTWKYNPFKPFLPHPLWWIMTRKYNPFKPFLSHFCFGSCFWHNERLKLWQAVKLQDKLEIHYRWQTCRNYLRDVIYKHLTANNLDILDKRDSFSFYYINKFTFILYFLFYSEISLLIVRSGDTYLILLVWYCQSIISVSS